MAEKVAEMSVATRLKVGTVVVKNNNVIGFGWNGTPSGWDNNCEDKVYNTRFKQQANGDWIDPLTYEKADIEELYPFVEEEYGPYYEYERRYALKTKPEVLHSESNALMKIARSTESSEDATMFCTHAPCLECAKLIYQSGIRRLYYRDAYRSTEGVEFLQKGHVYVEKYNDNPVDD